MAGYATTLNLLDGVVATGPGPWRMAAGIQSPTIQVSGITTATIQVEVSNDKGDPTNVDQDGANITADGVQTITAGYRWVRANVSVWTSGTISARLSGQTIF